MKPNRKKITLPKAARDAVIQRLENLYQHHYPTSGQVKVKSLRFSNHPPDWQINSSCKAGQKYTADFYRTNVLLAVCLPTTWAEETFTPRLIRRETPDDKNIIIGATPLPAPEGIDQLELVCTADVQRGFSHTVRTRWFFLFTLGTITARIGLGIAHPSGVIARDIAAAHKEFATIVAAKVAKRLLPTPKNSGGLTANDFKDVQGVAWTSLTNYAVSNMKKHQAIRWANKAPSLTPLTLIHPILPLP